MIGDPARAYTLIACFLHLKLEFIFRIRIQIRKLETDTNKRDTEPIEGGFSVPGGLLRWVPLGDLLILSVQ